LQASLLLTLAMLHARPCGNAGHESGRTEQAAHAGQRDTMLYTVLVARDATYAQPRAAEHQPPYGPTTACPADRR
jgi:hypothetical protein